MSNGRWLVVSLLALFMARHGACGEEPAKKEKEWNFQNPVVLHTEDPPNARNFLHLAPIGFVWCESRPVLVSLRGVKSSPHADIWTTNSENTWHKAATIPGASGLPGILAIGADVGVVASVGENPRSGYDHAIRFFRARLTNGKTTSTEVHPSPGEDNRLTVSGVASSGKTINVFLLDERREKKKNGIVLVRSVDGGENWSRPKAVLDTTMHEDNSRLPVLHWGADRFGRFVVERDGRTTFLSTNDGGATWQNEAIKFADDLSDPARRIPLRCARAGDDIHLVYLGVPMRRRDQARYYMTRSRDRGRTWSRGQAITKVIKPDDTSMFVNLAVAQDRMAFSYIESLGQWTRGEMATRLLVSADRGKTWQTTRLSRYYRGVALFSALTASPKADKVLFATSICLDPRKNPRNYLVVQEHSPRPAPPTDLTSEQTRAVRRLINALGDDSYEVREAATQKLAAIGTRAKTELLSAQEKNTDPEIRIRLKLVIRRVFPACLQVGPAPASRTRR